MVEPQSSKLMVRVRFPSSPPTRKPLVTAAFVIHFLHSPDALAWMAADRRAHAVDRVLMVGGFPASEADEYAPFFDIVDGSMPFPGWEPFEGPDSHDLNEAQRNDLASRTHPVPELVAHGHVEYLDASRLDIPVVLVRPEYSADDARALLEGGDLPELSRVRIVDYADIESGHWPMVTQPRRLADLIDRAVQ